MSRRIIEAYCADGVVCIPGSGNKLHLSRGFRLRAPETRAATNRVRNRMCACVAQSLSILPENGCLRMDFRISNDFANDLIPYARSTPADAPTAVQRYRNAKAVHFLRAAQNGELRREEVTIWLGQDLMNVKPGREDKKDLGLFYSGILTDAKTGTDNLAETMRAVLAPVGINLHPLDSQAVLEAWQRTLNPSPASRRRKLTAPADAFSLTDLCWNSELRGLGDRGFILDGEIHKLYVLQRLPALSFAGIPDCLTTLPIRDFTIVVYLRRLPKAQLLADLQTRLQRVQRQQQSRRNPQLEVTQNQLEEKITQLARGLIVPLELKFIIALHAPTPDELRRQEDLVKGAAARINMQLFEASLAATCRDVFLMTLPGCLHSDDPCFVAYGESEYLAPLLPIPNTFEADLDGAWALFEGPYRNLIGVRCFVGEGKALTPQHCLFSGTTGSGKSFFLDKLELETHHCFDQSWIIDFGESHRPYCDAVGGENLVITPDCPWTFNAFKTEGLPSSSSHRALVTALATQITGVANDSDEAQDKQVLLAKHVAEVCIVFADAWLRRQPEAERLRVARHALVLHQMAAEKMCEPTEAFISLRDDLNANDANALKRLAAPTEAEVRVFATKHRDAMRELAFAYMPEYPTLSALREHLELDGRQDEKCQRLADRLRPWCRGGSYGKLFDGQSNAQLTGKVTRLELGKLDKTGERFQNALWFLLLIVICQHCLSRPKHELKRIVLEEVGRILAVPGNDEILRSIFSTFRKLNVQAILVCQQIGQLENATLRSIILGNIRMAFLFNPGSAKDLDLFSERLPLSDAAKAMILKYVRPDQLRGKIYSECCYFHLTSGEPYCGTIRFVPPDENIIPNHEN